MMFASKQVFRFEFLLFITKSPSGHNVYQVQIQKKVLGFFNYEKWNKLYLNNSLTLTQINIFQSIPFGSFVFEKFMTYQINYDIWG